MLDLFDREADNVKYYIEDQLGSIFFVKLQELGCKIAINVDDETLCPEVIINSQDELEIVISTEDLLEGGEQVGYYFVIMLKIEGDPLHNILTDQTSEEYVNKFYRWARITKLINKFSNIEVRL